MPNNLEGNNSPANGEGRVFGVPKRRQEIIGLLTEAYARDYLEQDEFERRLERVERARTIEELEAVIADFPAGSLEGHQARGAAVPPKVEIEGDLERQVEILDGLDAPTRFTLLGDQHLVIRPDEPRVLRSVSVIGDTRIDLRALSGTPGVFLLKIAAVIGDTKIVVPGGTQVQMRLFSLIGGQRRTRKGEGLLARVARKIGAVPEKNEEAPRLPGPTVVVTGVNLIGDIVVVED